MQPTVRTIPVIKASIVLDNDTRFGQRKEHLSIKALIAKAAMKTFNPSILPGTVRIDIGRLYAGPLTPILDDSVDKFWPMVQAVILGNVLLDLGVGAPCKELRGFSVRMVDAAHGGYLPALIHCQPFKPVGGRIRDRRDSCLRMLTFFQAIT